MTVYYNKYEDGSISEWTEIQQDRFEFQTDDNIVIFNGKQYLASEVNMEEYEAYIAAQERARLDALKLTPADVERALYGAKEMDFEDLKALIHEQLPQIDIKRLAIEFRAKDFYRGATANNMRLFDVVGELLGYTSEDMDYLFENKELPVKEEVSEEE